MNSAQMGVLLRHIRTLAADRSSSSPLDGELLERFSASRDEEAFASLVQRHGPMVWSVCRHVLHNWHDAEDVFQATFLVLARKAAGIYRPESLASWLYGVAYHLAVKAQARSARQRVLDSGRPREPSGVAFEGPARLAGPTNRRQDMASADPLLDMTWRELRTTLYEELARLPAKNRTPLVLCYLEGKTQGEAARLLGWTKETVRGRLDRGREQLRKRLTRRGLALTSALFSTLLAHDQALAVPASLLKTTVKSAALMAAGKVAAGAISSKVAALASSGLKDLLVAKLKITVAVLLVVCTAGTGAGILGLQALADGRDQAGNTKKPAGGSGLVGRENPQSPSGKTPAPPAAAQGKAKTEDDGKLTITGRVVDANDNPVADVPVVILGVPKNRNDRVPHFLEQKILGQTKAGTDGRFRLALLQTSLANYQKIYGFTRHATHGLVWQEIPLGRRGAETILRLSGEKILRGRLLDLQGQPAVGVQVKLSGGEQGGVWLGGLPKEASSLWPDPVTTDKAGRFTMHGLDPRMHGYLKIESDHFAPREVEIKGDGEKLQEVNLGLAPAQIIEGVVTAADTGKPLAHAPLVLRCGDNPDAPVAEGPGVLGETDEQGHFHLNPYTGKMFTLGAEAPAGQPYLKLEKSFQWPKGAVKHTVDLALPKGVLVRGQVTEAASGKPVAGAIVRDAVGLWLNTTATTGPDGKFQLTVKPGPGHLLIKGPDHDFIPMEITEGELAGRKPSGSRLYPDAVVPLDLKSDIDSHQIAVQLRRGVTVHGTLLKPDGKPPTQAVLLCWSQVPQHAPVWVFGAGVSVFDGQFELRGCDPEKTYKVYFLDVKNELGAAVKLSASEAKGKAVTVRLSPCGSAEARFVDKEGNPLPRFRPPFYIVARPGPRSSDKEPSADNDFVANVDRQHYPSGGPPLDKEGRAKFPCLIPGATYRILDYDSNSVKDFSVEAGQTLKLGDIVINRPQ